MKKKSNIFKIEKVSENNVKEVEISIKKFKRKNNEELINQNKIKDLKKEKIQKKNLNNIFQNFKPKYKYKNISIKISVKITYFIWSFLLFNLINYISSKSSSKKKRKLDTLNIIYINITGFKNTKILGIKHDFPNITYLNGVKTNIDTSGNIYLYQNGKG